MRILLANSFHYARGGDSAQYLDIARLLESRGHEVAAFSMRHPRNLPSAWDEYWAPNVEYRRSFSLRDRATAALRSTYSLTSANAIGRMLTDYRPDIVHFHSVHHHLTLSVVNACLRAGVPVVWTLHDYRTVCPATALLRGSCLCERCAGGRFWHGLAGRCKDGQWSKSLATVAESYFTAWNGVLARVDCYLAPSQFLGRKVLAMGLPARRMEVLPNAVGISPRPTDSGRRTGLLYVGRLSREKGLDVLLKALEKLPDLRLLVVGEGPERRRLEAAVGLARLRVTFLGWQERATIIELMSKAEALCVPSVCYENCPGVVLEAMLTDLPVVASDLGGLRELLDCGRTGWLARPGDIDHWVHKIRDALTHDDTSRLRVGRARERAIERHGELRFTERLVGIYTSLM